MESLLLQQNYPLNQIQIRVLFVIITFVLGLSEKIKVPLIHASSWSILDMNRNEIILSKKGKKQQEIASLTKIMTCLVVLNLVKRMNIDPTKQIVKVSKQASSMIGTTAQLEFGDELSVMDLLYGLMLPSGNDAAQCLAEFFGKCLFLEKSEFDLQFKSFQISRILTIKPPDFSSTFSNQKFNALPNKDFTLHFINEMNKISRLIGLKQTTFANPHGLINKFNISTSHDICRLSKIALSIPSFAQIVNTKIYTCDINQGNFFDRQITWKNTNKLLAMGFNGIKTGITDNAGPCLSASFEKYEFKYIIVIFKTKSKDHRFKDAAKMAKWILKLQGFQHNFQKIL